MLTRMVPVTYLFVVLFGERTWVNEFAFAAWPRSATDRRLSWREQHGRLGMCFFVSGERVLRSLPWMWASRRLASEARLLVSQVVDRVGRIEVPPPLAAAFMYMYRLTGGLISGLLRLRATASPFTRASCCSWSSNGHTSTTVGQKIRIVPHFLQPPAIDKEPESNAKMYVNQRRDEMAQTWKHILRHDHFRAKHQYVGVFSNAVFNHFPLEDFSQTNVNRLVGAPRAHFRQKL